MLANARIFYFVRKLIFKRLYYRSKLQAICNNKKKGKLTVKLPIINY